MSGTQASTSAGFIGPANIVFQICTISCSWLISLLNSSTNPQLLAQQCENVFDTLINANNWLSAYNLGLAWNTELALLQQVQVLPLFLPQAQAQAFNTRINALQEAILQVNALLPSLSIPNTIGLLDNNDVAINDPGLLEWMADFALESPPSGFNPATIAAFATQAAANWAGIATAVFNYQTTAGLTQAYDECTRIAASLNQVSTLLTILTSDPYNLQFESVSNALEPLTDTQGSVLFDTQGNILYPTPFNDSTSVWNQIVTMPSMNLTGASIYTAPSSNLAQQCGVIKNIILNSAGALANLIISFKKPSNNSPNLATLQASDDLLDLAARALGDVEEWVQIAQLNGLTEPWIGLTNSMPGDALILPQSGSVAAPSVGSPITNYNINVLGTDFYFGPIDGQMEPWTGDIPLISGVPNLQQALTRRILTTLGTLRYHSTYGSRIPPQVGQVQDTATAQLITAFGTSALLSDPRVQTVNKAQTQINAQITGLTGSTFGVDAFTANVTPIGISGGNGINVDLVLGG